METGNNCINIHRSVDGGNNWFHYFWVCGGGDNDIIDPAITIPERTEDFLYVAYEYANQIQIIKINLSDNSHTFHNVASNILGVHRPRITTDNAEYTGYYLYVTYISGTLLAGQDPSTAGGVIEQGDASEVRFASSTDRAVTWGNFHTFHIPDFSDPLPRPDVAFGGGNVYVTWDEEILGPSTEMDVYVSRSTNFGSSWDAGVNLASGTSVPAFDPRAAAIQDGAAVMVAYTKDYTSDTDVWYSYSTDNGATWNTNRALASAVDVDEERPDICTSGSLGNFHVVYWNEYDIIHRQAPRTSPTSFSGAETVNDNNYASKSFYPPTVAEDWPSGEGGVAWSDFQAPTYSILFDRADFNGGPEPDIKAEGSDGPVDVPSGDPVNLVIELDANGWTDNSDWWLLAETAFGWYHYHTSNGWQPGFALTYQGPLFDLTPMEVMDMALPDGSYQFYFGVDTVPNGTVDLAQLYYDSVIVNVADCVLGTDSDGDRLDNCYETDTGVYVSPTDTGTDPYNADTDGDAIDDGDEVLGTLAGLNLPAMGANPLRKDIFIEYDWFDDSLDCGAHSHRPSVGVLNRAAAAFANAPVPNPDGSTGINFHQDRGQGGQFTGGNLINDANGVLAGGVNGTEFANYKAANFAANREGYFHYVIMPHRYNTTSGSSGQAELPGDDLIVSLQCYLSDTNVANTIVHELGHNLDLRHGGNTNCNYKPNYNSIMNYKYQFPGIDNNCTPPGDGVLDYSIGDRITLNENNLNENLGTCGSPSWDWNGNSVIETGVVYDINSSDTYQVANCGGTHTTLTDYNDWANLLYSGVQDADGAVLFQEIIDCDNRPPEAE